SEDDAFGGSALGEVVVNERYMHLSPVAATLGGPHAVATTAVSGSLPENLRTSTDSPESTAGHVLSTGRFGRFDLHQRRNTVPCRREDLLVAGQDIVHVRLASESSGSSVPAGRTHGLEPLGIA